MLVSFKAPIACVLLFVNNITALPIIRSSCATPVGLGPGLLFSGISLKLTNDTKDDVDSNSSTRVAVLKARVVKILRQLSASRPDIPA